MSNLRFYSPHKLHIDAIVALSNSVVIHVTKVMRLNVNDKLVLFDGSGFDFECVLTSVQKNAAQARVLTTLPVNTESPLKITLLQGISSGDRMDYSIQKAVELGVSNIQPITTQRSLIKLSEERAEKRLIHWQNVAISACEQCGRAIIPQILAPQTLANWLANNKQAGMSRILLNPIGAKRLAECPKPSNEIQLLIGAEGGLSQPEIDLATSQGFQSVMLGPRILRTETAGPTAIATLQAFWGDF